MARGMGTDYYRGGPLGPMGVTLWGVRLIMVVAGAFWRLEIVVAVCGVVLALQRWIEVKKPAGVSWVGQRFARLLEE